MNSPYPGSDKPKHLHTPLLPGIIADLHAGDLVFLSGTILTARDAAHKRLVALIDKGESLPVDLAGQILYYTGPSPARPQSVSGSAGPTTSSRMDSYTPLLLKSTGLKGMIGKGNRDTATIEAIKQHTAVYFAATGGAGALLAKCIVAAQVVCYEDLGPEAIHRLEIVDMPLLVAIDSTGRNLYTTGPAEFRSK